MIILAALTAPGPLGSLSGHYQPHYQALTRSSLRYGSVTRADHGAMFTCAASNTNLSSAVTATATLRLKCKSDPELEGF